MATEQEKEERKFRDIDRDGVRSVLVAPLFTAKRALEKWGYQRITIAEQAKLRMIYGSELRVICGMYYHPVLDNTYVDDGFILIPKGDFYYVRHSPFYDLADKIESIWSSTTDKNERKRAYFLTDEQAERAIQTNSYRFKQGNILLRLKTDGRDGLLRTIPTNRLGEDEFTVVAFGSEAFAKEYGYFLGSRIKRFFSCENKCLQVWGWDRGFLDSLERPMAVPAVFGRMSGFPGWVEYVVPFMLPVKPVILFGSPTLIAAGATFSRNYEFGLRGIKYITPKS